MNLRIKELRKEKNLTQKNIAEILGVSQAVYSRWEIAKDIIPLEKLIILCNFYQINLDYIFKINNNKINILESRNPDKFGIGNYIKCFRKEKKITQIELAQLLNTTQSTVSAFENGKVLILTNYLYILTKIYKLSIDQIVKTKKNDE